MSEHEIREHDILEHITTLEGNGFTDILGFLSLNVSNDLKGILDILFCLSEEIKSQINNYTTKDILKVILSLEKEYNMSLLEISEFMSVLCIHFWFRQLFDSSEKIYEAVLEFLIEKKISIEEEIMNCEDILDDDSGNENLNEKIKKNIKLLNDVEYHLHIRNNVRNWVKENEKICQNK